MRRWWFWRFLFPLPVAAGEVWGIQDANPFARFTVCVEDVTEGWVRYRLANGLVSELSVRDFNSFYLKVTP